MNVINGKRGRLFKDITQIKSIIPDHVGSSGQIALANIVNNASEVSITSPAPEVKEKFQLRDPYNLTDREMLVGALETAATSDAERDALDRYRDKIAKLYAQRQLRSFYMYIHKPMLCATMHCGKFKTSKPR